jgi:membrane-bound lytic murein transglycosylase
MKPLLSSGAAVRATVRAAVCAACAVLAACASDPPTAPALAVSAASVEAARSAGAPEYAQADLTSASTKLDQARALARAGNNRQAVWLAEEADADAQVARAQAGSERSRKALAEVEAGLRTLREELARKPAGAPRSPQ